MNQRLINIIACFSLMAVCVVNNGSAQVFSTDNIVEELFVYQVKGIDEFMQRFNDEKTSFIRKEYERVGKPYNVSRSQMLIALFNMDRNWTKDTGLIRGFCNKVIDIANPQSILFEDSNWYAEVRCVFTKDNKRVEIPVILHIDKDEDNGTKWLIAGIGDNTVLNDTGKFKVPEIDKNKAVRFIPPNSFATNFVTLYNVFSDSMQPGFFFEPQVLASGNGKHFIELVLRGKIKFQYVKNVRYHFYQVNDWIFNVEEFNRPQYNSGWLINGLNKAGPSGKEAFKKKLLHL